MGNQMEDKAENEEAERKNRSTEESLFDGIRKKRTEETESQVARSGKDTDERK
jgi:hypothetical protein